MVVRKTGDKVTGFEPRGRGFESLRVRQFNQRLMTLLKNKCSYETQKFLENSDFESGKQWLGNRRNVRY